VILNRRRFLAALVASRLDRQTIRIATSLGAAHPSAIRGFELGVEEAKRSAALLNVDVVVVAPRAKSGRVTTVVADGRGAAVAPPGDGALYIIPPADIQAAALERWRQADPARRPPAARIVTWHHALERYGARQLNDRFERRFSHRMDGDAWSAWMAVKIVVETALRKGDILQMRFDGHKGAPLAFDRARRYLSQPLYVVHGSGDAERFLGEAPPAV